MFERKDVVYYVDKTSYNVRQGKIDRKVISGGKIYYGIEGDRRLYPEGMVSKNLKMMMDLSSKLQYEAL